MAPRAWRLVLGLHCARLLLASKGCDGDDVCAADESSDAFSALQTLRGADSLAHHGVVASESDERVGVRFRLETVKGRIGNLMFEWASLVGLAKRAGAEVQAYFPANHDTREVPAGTLWKRFGLDRFSHAMGDLENAGVDEGQVCTVRFSQWGPAGYDQSSVDDMLANVKRAQQEAESNPDGCKTVEVVMGLGFYESFRYFENVKDMMLRAFAPPPDAKAEAEKFLSESREDLEAKHPGSKWTLVGVQVRRGDKVYTKQSRHYFQINWAYYREGMRMLEEKILASAEPNTRVAFIVTAGGSLTGSRRDVREAEDNLGGLSHTLVFSHAADPLVDYAIIAGTPAKVISSSTFGWWAAYVSSEGREDGMVVAPRWQYGLHTRYSRTYKVEDYYPRGWTILDNNITDGQLPA